MTEKEYIESFGFDPEDLTADELEEVREELRDIESGAIVLDGVLAMKPIVPKSK